MKKVIFGFLVTLTLSVSAFSDAFDSGVIALEKGDYQKAKEFFSKACDGKNTHGCGMLGIMYEKGRGVKQNFSKAKEFYGKACDDEGDEFCNLCCDNYKKLSEAGY